MKHLLHLALLAVAATTRAQTLATVSPADATVTTAGHAAEVSTARIAITGSSSILAKDRNAPLALTRGGSILLCRTSSLHLAGSPDTLLIGFDRGALELHLKASATDAILTPDMRITTAAGGSLDLRMRVSTDGDTCIENRGRKAPTLLLRDNFGEASYLVLPDQHVLFEHGRLTSVVDRETTPCGCPPEDPHAVPLAEAILHGTGAAVTPQQAAAANPFPVAQSAGLAPAPPLPADSAGDIHTQVSTTIAFDPSAARAEQQQAAAAGQPNPAPRPQPSEPARGGPFRAVGRFFKRIFVR